MREIDLFFLQKDEPLKSSLLYLREFILGYNSNITEAWKYGMPFYCYKDKMFCYLWMHKKYGQPYPGIVEGGKINHPLLLQEKRARMKIMLVDPLKDIPVGSINSILKKALVFYK